MTIEDIAKIAHQANKAYCESLGDFSQNDWDSAPDWQKNSCISGVNFLAENLSAGPDASHNNWLKDKEADGWTYGSVKDVEKKEHPCFVPYEDLPAEQQLKDGLFYSIVTTLLDA